MVRFAYWLEHRATLPGGGPALAGLTRPVMQMDPHDFEASLEQPLAEVVRNAGVEALLRDADRHRVTLRLPLIGGGLAVMAAQLAPLTEEQQAAVSRCLQPVRIVAPLDAMLGIAAADLLDAIGDPAEPWGAGRATDIAQCMERVQRALAGRPS